MWCRWQPLPHPWWQKRSSSWLHKRLTSESCAVGDVTRRTHSACLALCAHSSTLGLVSKGPMKQAMQGVCHSLLCIPALHNVQAAH
jgi:hypothetical protein